MIKQLLMDLIKNIIVEQNYTKTRGEWLTATRLVLSANKIGGGYGCYKGRN